MTPALESMVRLGLERLMREDRNAAADTIRWAAGELAYRERLYHDWHPAGRTVAPTRERARP